LTAICCYLPLETIIEATVVIRIPVMFIGQIAGLHLFRKLRPDVPLPFRMRLYPLASLTALAGWCFILATSKWEILETSLLVTVSGIPAYFVWKRFTANPQPTA
jgi:hypothetical protein